MQGPLLETKVYAPRPTRGLVSRPRLNERLGQRTASGLTLISAPAGFGKTTLLSDWLAAAPDARPTAWLSLDPSDNHPASFWTYLIGALQKVAPGVGAKALALLQKAPIEAALTTLLNDLNSLPNDLVLVLDDYHVVDASEVQNGMAFLIDHLPAQVHLVIATRADPALPLARLRARGKLVELRAAELRFTPDEAAAYLNGVMGQALTAGDIAALERRTEGWIAALQLASLSMQGRDDVAGFIASFAGDDRYIVDYLVEEVLGRQPEAVRRFLLQTAILDRLSGPLCDAVTGQAGGKAMLEAFERGNLFLVPLDDQRRWYRYHHLFGDVLRTRLLDQQPDRVGDLHRKASTWFEQNGEPSEAIRHALAAHDFERAAGLIELAVPSMRRSRQELRVLGWLKALPEELFRDRPVLSVAYAWALLVSGKLEGAERHLREAERWLDPAGAHAGAQAARRVVVDEEEFRHLPGSIALLRAASAQAVGDVANTVKYGRQVLALEPEDDPLRRGAAAGLLGITYWMSGELEAASQMYAECMVSMQRAGHLSDAIGCALALANIRVAQGRLREAMSLYERGLRLATQEGGPALRGAGDMLVGLSELSREQNNLEGAMKHLLRSKEFGEQAGSDQTPYRWAVAMARIREAEGAPHAALELLHEAERLYVSDYFPNVRPIAALKARVWAAQGRLNEAMGWVREQGLSVEGDLSYLREFEHITLARVLLARSRQNPADPSGREAEGLLERLLQAAEAGGRTGHVIEILLLQALARQAQGDLPAARVPLERAVALAEPEGYVRVFLDEGASMAVLLEQAAARRKAPRYLHQLLGAFGGTEDRMPVQEGQVHEGLVEPLSDREREVLRLLATDLDGPDIARELVVSLNTVRTHTKNIYAKLGVNSRRAAVRRAAELNLLSRTQGR